MIDNYADLNREETIKAVSGFGADRLQEFIDFERAHKDRVTVIEPLERDLVTVTPRVDRNYIAGVWFDDLDEIRTVRRSTRVEEALDAGELAEV